MAICRRHGRGRRRTPCALPDPGCSAALTWPSGSFGPKGAIEPPAKDSRESKAAHSRSTPVEHGLLLVGGKADALHFAELLGDLLVFLQVRLLDLEYLLEQGVSSRWLAHSLLQPVQ